MSQKMLDFMRTNYSELLNYREIFVLNVNIIDYSHPINNEECVLIRIEKELFKNIIQEKSVFRNDEYTGRYYLFAFKHEFDDHYGKRNMKALNRFASYIHNMYSNSLSKKYSGIIAGVFCTQYADWITYDNPDNLLEIPVSSIDKLCKLRNLYVPSLTDFDIQLIVTQLDKAEREGYIFRGVKEHYIGDDGISSTNYRNNLNFAKFNEFNHLQKHEKEIVENLLNYKNYNSVSTLAALTDLRHEGKDTNFLDFSESYKTALFFACSKIYKESNSITEPAEVFLLPTSNNKPEVNIEYPIKKDCLVKPNFESNHSKRVKSQDSIFVYCVAGYLSRKKYDGVMKNLVIAREITSALLKHCGKKYDDIYPDMEGFFGNDDNFKTAITAFHDTSQSANYIKNMISCIHDQLNDYEILTFLDIEICDYSEIIYGEFNSYMLVRPRDTKYLKELFRVHTVPIFPSDISKSIKFILGFKVEFYKVDRIYLSLTKIANAKGANISPHLTSIDMRYQSRIGEHTPENTKLNMSVVEFKRFMKNNKLV